MRIETEFSHQIWDELNRFDKSNPFKNEINEIQRTLVIPILY